MCVRAWCTHNVEAHTTRISNIYVCLLSYSNADNMRLCQHWQPVCVHHKESLVVAHAPMTQWHASTATDAPGQQQTAEATMTQFTQRSTAHQLNKIPARPDSPPLSLSVFTDLVLILGQYGGSMYFGVEENYRCIRSLSYIYTLKRSYICVQQVAHRPARHTFTAVLNVGSMKMCVLMN